METEHVVIATQLRRLDAVTAEPTLPFDYAGLLARHVMRKARAQRRHRVARASAGVLIAAFLAASVWRLEPAPVPPDVARVTAEAPRGAAAQPRIVRADTYFALASLEDHI